MKTQHEVNGDIIPWSSTGNSPGARLTRMTDAAADIVYAGDRLDFVAFDILEYLGDEWPGLQEVVDLGYAAQAELEDLAERRIGAIEDLVRQAMPAGAPVLMGGS